MAKKSNYRVVIEWSPEDRVYVARAPNLDGVVTDGRTPQEALRHVEEAMALYEESLKARRKKSPSRPRSFARK